MTYLCGCYYTEASASYTPYPNKRYLPQVDLKAHTSILSTTSRTLLTQTFVNPSSKEAIKECHYTFPLYDGVSVVGFICRIQSRLIKGVVKEKEKARQVYKEAIDRGDTAGLLEQFNTSDVFHTKLGNIPPGEKIIVEITYVGELKHDAETDGIRFTVPTRIAPRYGTPHGLPPHGGVPSNDRGGIRITVDASLAEGSFIRGIQSPSHPIAVTMGNTSRETQEDPQMHKASATLALGSTELDKDFVLIILAKDTATPKALLETHSSIANQRALMVTLVPKFALPPSRPEIVFVADRSGSMAGKIPTLVSALNVFLKSLPLGVRFNICSFGTHHSFLWPKSKAYSQTTLTEALQHVRSFDANFGGTETFSAVKATIESRYKDIPLEVMLLTDGDIWNQDELFFYLNSEIKDSKPSIRVFSLGIGNGVSHALIEGIARAGNGFAQSVGEGEKLDSKVVRMLKGGLSPHITDYTLEVKYDRDEDEEDDFELVDRVTDGLRVLLNESLATEHEKSGQQKPISLFDTNADPDKEDLPMPDVDGQGRYAHLPAIKTPSLLQAPYRIPPLFPFNRTTVYLLMGPQSLHRTPRSVVLKATSPHGPLELEIPVQSINEPGQTIHQLAAKKAIGDLEEGRGWIFDAKDEKGVLVKERFESRFDEMVQREAVRLGVQFQVGGKWCSFVAVEPNGGKESQSQGSEIPVGTLASSPGATMENNLPKRKKHCALGSGPALFGRAPVPRSSNEIDFEAAPAPASRSLFSASAGMPPDPAEMSSSPFPDIHARAKGIQKPHDVDSCFGLTERQTFQPRPTPQEHTQHFSQYARSSKRLTLDQPLGMIVGGNVRPPGSQHIAPAMRSGTATFRSARHLRPYALVAARSGDSEEDKLAGPDLVAAKGETDPLHQIIALQSFDGSWELNDKFLEVLKLSWSKVKSRVSSPSEEKVWATVLAICFLEKKMAEQKDAWELVVDKARVWLSGVAKDGFVEKLVQVAETLF